MTCGCVDLTVGATLPHDARIADVTLDGRRVKRPQLRRTNRGLEVTVQAPSDGRHTVVVTAG